MDRRIFFANFTGLGNCIAALGLFRAIEKASPRWSYFHTDCLGLEDVALIARSGVRNFAGTAPATWRRFCEEDWPDILAFLNANRIDTVINLRNEGPQRDTGYAMFKRVFADEFAFFDLNSRYARGTVAGANLFGLHADLLAEAGARVHEHLGSWLARPTPRTSEPGEIGVFTAASQQVKTWAAAPWIELGTLLLERTAHDLAVFAGESCIDVDRAAAISGALKARFAPTRVRMVSGLSTIELADRMAALDCLVSNDTSAVHLGAALGIPTVGLYFATIGRIWGGLSPLFTALQSRSGAHCRYQKHGAGNCAYFHGGCPAPCRDDVEPEAVCDAVMDVLDLPQTRPGVPAAPLPAFVSPLRSDDECRARS
jgi:ADP-heptose:LPS heptosyltransferase